MMERLGGIKIIFILAALIFVARPLIGFQLLTHPSRFPSTHIILVKAFSKRNPEFLVDTEVFKTAVSHQLTNPPVKQIWTIASLLCVLFPLLLFYLNSVSYRLCKLISLSLPGGQNYLLTGKLTI